ncbi:MATE family efflux transporter [Microbacterium sp.]|uniref:MATE family efflux transporter n=1 Tax=Microbacterium sp. TaxID=51671 RepID=UPI003C78DDB8
MSDTAPAFARKGLLRLSWPLLLVTVLTLLATLGNVVLLSASSAELNAAVATANQLLGVLYDVSVLFSLGALVVVAQFLGGGAYTAARRASAVALRASSILGIAMAIGVAVAAPLLLPLIRTPEDIRPDALAYLWVVAAGLAFNAYIVAASAVLRAYGRTVALLVLGVVVNVLDVALLYVCLFVLELGAVGAAIPTLVVRGIGALLLAWLVRSRTGVRMWAPLPPKEEGTRAWTMARLSVPTVLENGLYNIAIVVVVTAVNALGTDAINARSYALTLTALVTGLILALAQGNETIVGWDVGEDALAHARRQTVRTVVGTAVTSALLAALLWLGADPLLSIFGPNEVVLAETRTALAISVLLLPLSAVTAVVYGALRSAGDVVVPMAYSIGTSIVVLVPVSFLLVETAGLGVAGVFWGLVLAEAVKAALLFGRWLGGRWMQDARVVDAAVPAASVPA